MNGLLDCDAVRLLRHDPSSTLFQYEKQRLNVQSEAFALRCDSLDQVIDWGSSMYWVGGLFTVHNYWAVGSSVDAKVDIILQWFIHLHWNKNRQLIAMQMPFRLFIIANTTKRAAEEVYSVTDHIN